MKHKFNMLENANVITRFNSFNREDVVVIVSRFYRSNLYI